MFILIQEWISKWDDKIDDQIYYEGTGTIGEVLDIVKEELKPLVDDIRSFKVEYYECTTIVAELASSVFESETVRWHLIPQRKKNILLW